MLLQKEKKNEELFWQKELQMQNSEVREARLFQETECFRRSVFWKPAVGVEKESRVQDLDVTLASFSFSFS